MVSNVVFAGQTLTPKFFNSGFNAPRTKINKITYHAMHICLLHICLVMLILNVLVNIYTTAFKSCFSQSQNKKKFTKKPLKGMYCINCMADYSTPNLSYQSLATDDNASSTDSCRYHLTAFLIFQCTFAEQCISTL